MGQGCASRPPRRRHATKQKVRGVGDTDGDAQQLSNRLERVEGDIRRLYGLQCLNGPGPGVGNPGTHPVTHPDVNKGKPGTVAAPKAFSKPRDNRLTKMICWQCGLPGHLSGTPVYRTPATVLFFLLGAGPNVLTEMRSQSRRTCLRRHD